MSKSDMEELTNIRDLLTSWGFPDHIEFFEREEIDFKALRLLTEGAIASLFTRMGPRLKFSNMLQDWKKGGAEKSVTSNPTEAQGTPSNSDERPPSDAETSQRVIDYVSLLDHPSSFVMLPVDNELIDETYSRSAIASQSTSETHGSEIQTKYQNGQIIEEITDVVAHWVPLTL